MTITYCLIRGLETIYDSFLRLWERSGSRKCIFITPAGQENLIGQPLKCRGDAEASTFQFCPRRGNSSWANAIHLATCANYEKKKKRKSQNNVVNLLSQIKSPRRLDLGEPSWKGRARIHLGESFISVNIWEVCFSRNSFWNQNEKGHNRHKAQ